MAEINYEANRLTKVSSGKSLIEFDVWLAEDGCTINKVICSIVEFDQETRKMANKDKYFFDLDDIISMTDKVSAGDYSYDSFGGYTDNDSNVISKKLSMNKISTEVKDKKVARVEISISTAPGRKNEGNIIIPTGEPTGIIEINMDEDAATRMFAGIKTKLFAKMVAAEVTSSLKNEAKKKRQ